VVHRCVALGNGVLRGRIHAFVLLLILFSTACGDFWELDSSQMTTAQQMAIDRRVLTLPIGDSCTVPVSFTPDSLHNNTIYWETLDTTVAVFVDDTLIAVREGVTQVVAFTTVDRLRDTCWVQVVGPLSYNYGRYPYDMLLYASVDVHGRHLTVDNSDSIIVGAFVGDELRGIGQMKRAHDIDYMALRIESPLSYGESLLLRCYHRGQAYFEIFPDTITFTGESMGTLSKLYPLVLDESAQAYEPDISVYTGDDIIIVPDTFKVVVER